MIPQIASRCLTGCVNFLALAIRCVQINRVEFFVCDGVELVSKRRVWFSHPLIIIGNLVFRFRHPAVRVLPTQEWIAWEQTVQSVLKDDTQSKVAQLKSNKKAWITEKIPGTILADLLQREEMGEAQKLLLVSSAAKSLFEFHSQIVCLDSRQREPGNVLLSHGDATVQNILVDPELGIARWFDFDLLHDLRIAAEVRQADDLRAFLYSLIFCCPWNNPTDLMETVRGAYSNQAVWNALSCQLTNPGFRWDLFHQSHIRRSRGRQLYRVTKEMVEKLTHALTNQ